MWYPGYGVNKELVQLVLACLDDSEVKAEIARQVRIEVDNERKNIKAMYSRMNLLPLET